MDSDPEQRRKGDYMMKDFACLAIVSCLTVVLKGEQEVCSCSATSFPRRAILCDGGYKGHLQGVATDGTCLYWSFTVDLVKTDLEGRLLTAIEVPNHHGDLCVKDGVVYVAVNLGKFNFENEGISEVRAYSASDMKPVGRWPLPMCGHGAGGMTCVGDRFFVVGGLPATHECNHIYEFMSDFTFVKRHELQTGFTLMGIQTAAFEDGRFIFGIYGCVGDPCGSLECPRDLTGFVRRLGPGCAGILKLNGEYWTGGTCRGENGLLGGFIEQMPGYPTSQSVFEPHWTGKGGLRIFFEDMDVSGWKDSGYCLEANGYRPLCNLGSELDVYFPKGLLGCSKAVLPAVGVGGNHAYSVLDLVRAVRRVAETDEAFALHVPGTPDKVKCDQELMYALNVVKAEANRLGVEVVDTLPRAGGKKATGAIPERNRVGLPR